MAGGAGLAGGRLLLTAAPLIPGAVSTSSWPIATKGRPPHNLAPTARSSGYCSLETASLTAAVAVASALAQPGIAPHSLIGEDYGGMLRLLRDLDQAALESCCFQL